MGHTPGPWYANGDCIEADGPEGPRDITLAVVTGTRAGHEVAADAHLISAAPDLLASLKAIVEASQFEGEVAWLEKLWPQVNAALDKAEGTDGQDRSMD